MTASLRTAVVVLAVAAANPAPGAAPAAAPGAAPPTGQTAPDAGANAAGEEERVVRLTLAEALERALDSSPTVAELRALRSAAVSATDVAAARRWPDVDLRARYTRLSSVPELVLEVPGLDSRTIFTDIPNDVHLRAEFSVPLYSGGRIEHRAKAARDRHRAADHDLRAGRSDVVLETKLRYWELVVAREEERVLTEALDAFEAHLRDARNRRRFGLAARNEVLAVEVELERAEHRRIRAESAVAVARANLAVLLGLEPTVAVVPVDDLEAVPGDEVSGERPAPAPADRDTPDAVEPAGPVEELVERALASRPEVAALKARVAAARSAVEAEKGDELPLVSAVGGFDYANPNRRILPPSASFKDSWDLSVNLTFDLLDGGQRDAEIAEAVARAEATRQRLLQLQREIRRRVTSRHLELRNARAAVRVARRALAAAREARRVAADRYREGLIPSSELLDAENAEMRSGLELTDARVRVRIARARLEHAVGETESPTADGR